MTSCRFEIMNIGSVLLLLLFGVARAQEHPHHGLRGLDEWTPPTREDFVQALLDEIASGNDDLLDLVPAALAALKQGAPVETDWFDIEDDLIIIDGSSEAGTVIEALLQANQEQSICSIPEKCFTIVELVFEANHELICSTPCEALSEQKQKEVEDLFLSLLGDYVADGHLSPEDENDIMKRVQNATGLEEKNVEALLDRSGDFLKDKVLEAENKIQRALLQGRADELEAAVLANQLGVNYTDYSVLLEKLELDEEDAAALIERVMGPEQRARVEEAIRKPIEEMNAKMTAAFNHMVEREGHFEEIHENQTCSAHPACVALGMESEESCCPNADGIYMECCEWELVDESNVEEDVEENGRRRKLHRGGTPKLRYVPHPESLSMDDQIRMIHLQDGARRRRLQADGPNVTALALERKLTEHVDLLDRHVRQLKDICRKGMPDIICVGKNLEALADNVRWTQDLVRAGLDPLKVLMDAVTKGKDAIGSAKTVGDVVLVALSVAANIPGYGTTFKAVKQVADKGMEVIKNINNKAIQFHKKFNGFLEPKIARVERIVDSFEPNAIDSAAEGANIVGILTESACVSSLVHNITGVDIAGGFKQSLAYVKTQISRFVSSLQALKDALQAEAVRIFREALQSVFNALKPIQDFFNLFEPLAALLRTEVELTWFSLPYEVKEIGPSTCPSGFYPSSVDGKLCWENTPSGWEETVVSSPPIFRRTCASGALEEKLWPTRCANRYYDVPFKSVGWGQSCPGGHSIQRTQYQWTCYKNSCNSGFYKNDLYCYKDPCPAGFSTDPDRSTCYKNERRQQSRRPVCPPTKPGVRSELYFTSSKCWTACNPEDTNLNGFCFPPATLKISIERIAKAFQEIVEYVKGLPIVKTIYDAIEWVCDKVLYRIKQLIQSALNNVFDFLSFPRLPSLSDYLDPLKEMMPQIPDLSEIRALPRKIFEQAMLSLPSPMDQMAACDYNEIGCMLKVITPEAPAFVGTLIGMVDVFKSLGEHVVELKDAITSIKSNISKLNCTKWSTKRIPTGNVLDTIGLPNVTVCDLELPFCKEFDLGGLQSVLDSLAEPVKAIIDLLKSVGQRRLEEAVTTEEQEDWIEYVCDLGLLSCTDKGGEDTDSKKALQWIDAGRQKLVEMYSLVEDKFLPVMKLEAEVGGHFSKEESGFFALGSQKKEKEDAVTKTKNLKNNDDAPSLPIGYDIRFSLPKVSLELGFKLPKGTTNPKIMLKFGASGILKAGFVSGYYQLMKQSLEKAKKLEQEELLTWSEAYEDCKPLIVNAVGSPQGGTKRVSSSPWARYLAEDTKAVDEPDTPDYLCKILVDAAKGALNSHKNEECAVEWMAKQKSALKEQKSQGLGLVGRFKDKTGTGGNYYFEKKRSLDCIRYWFRAESAFNDKVKEYETEKAKFLSTAPSVAPSEAPTTSPAPTTGADNTDTDEDGCGGNGDDGDEWWENDGDHALELANCALKNKIKGLEETFWEMANNSLPEYDATFVIDFALDYLVERGQQAMLPPSKSPTSAPTTQGQVKCEVPDEPTLGVDSFKDFFYYGIGARMEGPSHDFGPVFKFNRCGYSGTDCGTFFEDINSKGEWMTKIYEKINAKTKGQTWKKYLTQSVRDDFGYQHFQAQIGFEFWVKEETLGAENWQEVGAKP